MTPGRIETAEKLGSALNELVYGVEMTQNERNRAAAASFGIARDHHGAIVFLLKNTFHSSAFALLRCLFEAYLRGLWLKSCATDKQVTAHFRGANPPQTMIAEIEATAAFAAGVLSRIKKESWSSMCEYTHTGGRHLQRWQTADTIEPSFETAELDECLNFADLFAALAALELVQMDKSKNNGEAVLALMKQRWP